MKKLLKKWEALILISSALFIIVIDTTIINVSIVDVVKDLDTDIPTMQWAITIYALVMASLLIVGSKLGDIFGRKKMFVLGTFIYGIGTLTAALSPNIWVLLIGWSFLEGIGGALMMPASQSLIMDNYKGKDQKVAFGVWGAVAGVAVAFGPIVGGYLTTNASWRWAFALELTIVIIVLLLSKSIKENLVKKKIKFDFIGSILTATGLSSLVYGILEARTYGWWEAKKVYEIGSKSMDFGELSIVPIMMGFGLVILALDMVWLHRREKKGFDPLFSLKIFKFKDFDVSISTLFFMVTAMGGVTFVFPVFWQVVRTYTALETGLTFLPYSLAMIILAPVCGKLSHKISPKYIIQAGVLVTGIGIYTIARTLNVDSEWLDLFIPVGLFGGGMAMVFSQIQHMILSSVEEKFVGEASGLNSTLRQLGQSLGTAVVGTIFLSLITTNMVEAIEDSKGFPEEQKAGIIEQVEESSEKLGGDQSDEGETPMPHQVSEKIIDIRDQAIVDAADTSFVYSAIFIAVAFVVSFWLPKEDVLKEEKN